MTGTTDNGSPEPAQAISTNLKQKTPDPDTTNSITGKRKAPTEQSHYPVKLSKGDQEPEQSRARKEHDSAREKTSKAHITNDRHERQISDHVWAIRDAAEADVSGQERHSVLGHLTRGRLTEYLVQYGPATQSSVRFERAEDVRDDVLESYTKGSSRVDVASSKDRIIEKIIKWHREEGKLLPIKLLRNHQILSVYWDGKMGLGHKAEIKAVLDPQPVTRERLWYL